MDRLVYISMTGAQQVLQQQAVTAHNLANTSTVGFKAEMAAFRAAPVVGPGLNTRAYAVDTTTGADMTPGPLQETGRDLDVAVEGDGLFAVQGRDGTEAYTRAGSFDVSPEGELLTRSGLPVLSDQGPVTVPPDSKVSIGKDGTISATTPGQAGTTVVAKLKLVNPDKGVLVKSGDGLFRTKGGAPLEDDPNVRVVHGRLEGSNVNPVGAMVEMINLARNFELQMKLLSNVEQNEQRATQLLSYGG